MKITIVETEIQEAIRAFIRSQIEVKEGMEITMELRATRGDEGFIANIDISPAKVTTKTQAKPAVTRTTAVTPPAPKASATETALVETAATVFEPVPEVEEVGASVQVVSTAPAGRDASDDEDAADGEAPLKPSIFSGLRRPTNGTAEATA